jgi:hypothetical protein
MDFQLLADPVEQLSLTVASYEGNVIYVNMMVGVK